MIRRTETEFEVVPVEAWIAEDDLLTPENVVMDLKMSRRAAERKSFR